MSERVSARRVPSMGEFVISPAGRLTTMVLAMTLGATTLTLGQVAAGHSVLPSAQAASGTPVTSSDGRITLTKTASTTTLGATGGSVTYTYKVANNSAGDEYYDSFTDDKCGSPNENSGMSQDAYGADIIPAHGTATFTCTQKVTTTTTNNATFVAEDYNQYYLGTGKTSTVTASATVTVSAGTGNFNCDTLWYGSMDNGSDKGSLGTWDPATNTVKPLFQLSSANGISDDYDSTAATAVSAANPNVTYFTTRQGTTYGADAAFSGNLYAYNASTGKAKLVDSEDPDVSDVWETNRLGAAPDGTIWSLTVNGELYSYNPTTDKVTDHGIPQMAGVDFTQLNSGDLTFDGLGNMWVLSSSGNNGGGATTNLLVTIPASQLSGQNPQATKVGTPSAPGTGSYFNGLAFTSNGTLYATSIDSSGNPTLYTVNKDTGAVTKVVSTSGTTTGGPQAISDLGSCALPAPNLVVSKTVDQSSIGLGGTLSYTVTIKNTGTLSATGVNWNDATPANTTYVSSTLNGTAVGTNGTNYWASAQPVNGATTKEAGVIPAGDTATVKMTVKVNSTTNGATAVCNQGTSAYTGSTVPIKSDDPTQSGSTDATCSQILKPGIAVAKTATPTTLQGSGPVTYTYKVTNAGNESLKTVSLGDDKCTAVTGPAAKDTTVTPATGDVNGNNQLDVGETWLYSCTQTLSATTTNTATATGTGVTTGTTVNSTAKATVTLAPAAINIAKSAGTVSGPDASGNYTVSYTVTATNTGNGAGSYGPISDTPQFASNLVPTQASWSGAQSGNQALKASDSPAYGFTMGAARTLASGATDTYTVQTTFHYTNRTQAVACGGTGTGLYNSVSATGETGSTSDNSACVAPPAPPTESLSITKTPNPTTWTKVGDKVTYSFLVKNTGAVTMSNIQVSDTFTNPPAGNGDMTPISCPTTTLAPGASTTCTATYTITQADLDKGKVDNSATATGTPPDTGTPITSPPSTAETTSKATAAIGVVKTAGTPTDVNKDGLTDAGDTVVYTFVVTNTGTVTLNRPASGWNSDAKIGSSNINCPTGASSLAPGASVTCTSNAYTITAADVSTGAVNNTDTVTGVPADGSPNVTSQSSATVPTTTPAPGLSVTKAASQSTYKLGDVVKYTFTVTNTGNVPLSQIGVVDTFSTGGTGSATQVSCQATTLAAGAKTTCTFSYSVNQADVDAGKLVNTGSVTGTSPDGTKPTATSNQVTLTDAPSPALALTKSVQAVNDTNGNGITDAGDTISWNFVVSNTGNVTLAMPNGGWVSDSLLGSSAISCQTNGANVTSLAPGAKVTCTATPYTITSSDVTNGSVKNTATAHGTTPGGSTVPSNDSSTTTPTDSPAPGLSLTKSVSDASPGGNGDGIAQAGEKLTYSFAVKNTGNVEMDSVSVSDDSFTGSGAIGAISCPQDTLASGAQMTCTTTYTVTQADVDAANATSNSVLVNTAHATGTPAGSNTPQDSNTSTAQIPTPSNASVTIAKSVSDASGNGDGKAQSGEKLTYSFVITNTGAVSLSNVTAADSFTKGGTGVAGDVSCPSATLAPGASETCTMPYTVAAADMDQSSIDNSATASGTTPAGSTVKSTPATATITTDANPAITVVKKVARVRDVNADTITDAGDMINWTITVTNTGNTDLTNVAVQDPMLANASVAVTCPATSLAVGASMQCTTGNYTITTDDQSAGVVKNVATATATNPGNPNTPVKGGPSEVDTPVTTPNPHLTLTKTPNQSTFKPGDTITYTFHVTNDGNVPMGGIGVADEFTAGGSGTVGAMNCPQNTLAASASMDCTLTYTATQADADAGKIDNSASATGTPTGGGSSFTTPPATAEVTDKPAPSLALVKSIDQAKYVDQNNDGLKDAGDLMAWTFVVTNTGNVTLGGMYGYDPLLVNAPNVTLTCPAYTLAPGASELCSTTQYTITQDDQNAGAVSNTAFAFGYTPGNVPVQGSLPAPDPSNPGYTQSNDSSANQPLETPTPKMSVTKTASSTTFTAGDTITYSFHVSNDGNVPLTGVAVNDQFTTGGAGAASTVQCPSTSLAVGGAMDCTMTYVATQADANAGQVVNQATATGTPPSGTPITTPPSTATVTDTPNPSLTMTKSVNMSFYHDVNGDGLVDAGDTIAYAFAVVNTGNVTVTSLTVNDPMLSSAGDTITCPQTSLAPNDHTTCYTRAYTITDADQSAGVVNNTATATGTPPSGNPVTTPPSDTSTPIDTPKPHVSVAKSASTDSFVAGQTITYSFAVSNDGNVPLADIRVNDTFSPSVDGTVGDITCPQTTLAVGADMTCTMTYVATQADVDRGAITNNATATGTPPSGTPTTSTPSTVTVTDTAGPKLTMVKTVSAPVDVNGDGLTDAGDTVTYSFEVTNHGNVTMSNLAIDDPMLDQAKVALTCPVTQLAPDASTTCTSATYTITAADVDAGSVDNTATAKATPPGSTTPVPSNDSSTTTPTTKPAPAITVAKKVTDAAGTSTAKAGDTLNYTFTVTNTGNVALSKVAVDDTFTTGGTGTMSAISCPSTTLDAGASTDCTASYTVTQADVDAGKVANSATASGTPPTGDGGTVTSPPSTASIPTPTSSSLSLAKSASTPMDANGDGLVDAGDTMTFSFLVTNTGDVTMSNLAIDDSMLADAKVAVNCPVTTLAPGASTTCTSATYTITDADTSNGAVTNSATAKATPPGSTTPVTSPPSGTNTPTTVPVSQLALTKAVSDASGDGTATLGEKLTYTFTLTNQGNVALTDVSVRDDFTTGTKAALTGITCADTTLAPGAKTTCTASYTVTQADVDAGHIDNTATASGTPKGSTTPVDSPPATATIPTPNDASLSLVKSVSDANGDHIAQVGEKLTYSFVVKNTGSVTTSGISVSDTFTTGGTGTMSAITCPDTTLAPGASTTCTASYTVTQADVDAGALANTATASGNTPGGGTLDSPPSKVDIPTDSTASLELVKKAGTPSDVNGDGLTDAGDTIAYTFTVTNTGAVSMSGIGVTDDKLAAAGVTITCADTQLAPGASTTCISTPYTITADDVQAGTVHNSATAQGTPPGSTTPVPSKPSTTDTPTSTPNPAMSLTKSVSDASGDKVVQAGETLTYTFTLTNTGNVALSGLGITDAFTKGGTGTMSDITCPSTPLAPGATATCTATYVANQADVDAGGVTNSATAHGVPPTGDGTTVTTPPSTATIPSGQTPAIRLVKQASLGDTNGDGVGNVGEKITYSFVATNTGTVTLYDITLADQMLGLSGARCADGPLAPGDSVTCSTTGEHTITQADVDAGHVRNTATVTGDDHNPKTTNPTGDSSTDTPTTQKSKLDLVKDIDKTTWVDTNKDGLWDADDTYEYVFTITNTGDVTLTQVGVSDTKLDAAHVTTTCKATTLAPGEQTTCTSGAYTVTADDEKAGEVYNTATAHGTPPGSSTPTDSPKTEHTVPLTAPKPGLTLAKSVTDTTSNTSTARIGDHLRYTFTLTNTGNVTLTNPGVDDAMLKAARVAITCPAGALEPGDSLTCTSGDYTVTRADITAGQVANTATAQATPPGGGTTPSNPSTSVISTADIGLVKSAEEKGGGHVTDTNGDGIIDAGDQIVWGFTVTNSGKQDLTDVTVNDKTLADRGVSLHDCVFKTLAAGESKTCTSDAYTITDADQKAGLVHNVATARGVTVPGQTPTPNPTATPSEPSTEPSDSPSSPASSPSDSTSPTSTPTTPGGTEVVSPPSPVDVPVLTPRPGITVVKSVKDANGDGRGELGEKLTYSFLVSNTGNVDLRDVAVNDPMFDTVTCPATDLAHGASMTCTASWTVTQDNLDKGLVKNTATAHGTVPGNPGIPVVSPPSTVTIPVPSAPAIRLVKSAQLIDTNANKGADAGEKVVYTFVITNTGKVALHDLTLADPRLDAVHATYTWPTGHTLAPGASETITASAYTVTAADVAHSSIENVATATGTPPTGRPVTSTGHATVPVAHKVTPVPPVKPSAPASPSPSTPQPTTPPAPQPSASQPPARPTRPLANTGSDVEPWELGLGLGATALGLVLVALGRRRRRD